MGTVRKGILFICLTYFLVGALGWIYVGAFLPPMPGKPFFFMGILALYVLGLRKGEGLHPIGLVLISWVLTLAFSSLDFVELFFNYRFIKFYSEFIEPFMRLTSVLSIIGLSILFYQRLKSVSLLYLLPVFIAIALIPEILLIEYHFIYEAGLVAVGLIYFVLSLGFRSEKKVEALENEGLVMNGVTVILFLDQAAIFLGTLQF